MSRHKTWSHERRENLAELDPVVRDRLLGLDEPVERSDWSTVVQRSKAARRSRQRSFALVASGAAVLTLAFTVSLGTLFPGAGNRGSGAPPLRLALHLNDGSGLVLYSGTKRAWALDNSDGRLARASSARTNPSEARTASLVRSLSGGPFHVDPALVRTVNAHRVTDGPLPGDKAFVSFRVFESPELETAAGSAVLTCLYGFDRNAYCDGAVDLGDGVRLTASGTLDADANNATLVVTGDPRGIRTASPRGTVGDELD